MARGPDAVEVGAELDDVEVELENFGFAEQLFEPRREDRFLDLSRQSLRAIEKEILGKLHRDGARADGEAARLEVVRDGVADRERAEASVGEKGSVFAR